MTYDIVTIGGATRDVFFITKDGLIIKNPKDPLKQRLLAFELGAKIYSNKVWFESGGGACNTSASFSKLGLKTAAIACVGKDNAGEQIIKDLLRDKVDVRVIQKDTRLTTCFSFIVSSEKNEDHTIFSYRGANNSLKINFRFPKTKLISISSLSMNNWPKILDKIYKLSSQKKIKIVWNPGVVQLRNYKLMKKFLSKTDILILNRDEATELVLREKHKLKTKRPSMQDLLKAIYQIGPKIIVITSGEKKSFAFDGKNIYSQKPMMVKTVNTTGAGDAFHSGFVASLIYRPNDIKRALKWGTANATSVIRKIGAQNGILNLKSIKHYV